jgi:hypothetical protein
MEKMQTDAIEYGEDAMFSVETIGRWTEKKIILDGVVVHRLPLR